MENNLTKVEKIIIIVTVIAVIMIFGGIGYAFFTMNDNTGSTAEITNTSGKMTITYADGGSNLLVSNNIVPSDAIIANKTFTLTGLNTTTAGNGLTMEYKVGLKYTSSFSDEQIHYYIKKVSSTNNNITTTFAEDSWDTIAAVVQSGNMDVYAVGSEKEVEIDGKSYTVRVANNTTPDECNSEDFSKQLVALSLSLWIL